MVDDKEPKFDDVPEEYKGNETKTWQKQQQEAKFKHSQDMDIHPSIHLIKQDG